MKDTEALKGLRESVQREVRDQFPDDQADALMMLFDCAHEAACDATGKITDAALMSTEQIERVKNLKVQIEKAEMQDKVNAFARWVITETFHRPLDCFEIQNQAQERGLFHETIYDPGLHDRNHFDVKKGDAWLVIHPDFPE